jgi:hypothetical protein
VAFTFGATGGMSRFCQACPGACPLGQAGRWPGVLPSIRVALAAMAFQSDARARKKTVDRDPTLQRLRGHMCELPDTDGEDAVCQELRSERTLLAGEKLLDIEQRVTHEVSVMEIPR